MEDERTVAKFRRETARMIDLPFYHGGSSHYRSLLEIGAPIRPWPHKDAALELMRAAWSELQARGRQPEWYQVGMMKQHSGHANWQHGETYVTASRTAAARYAASNGEHGGELLNECAQALALLRQMDAGIAGDLRDRHVDLAPMLAGGGTPLLVRIEGVRIEDLQPEVQAGAAIERTLEETLAEIASFRANPALMDVVGGVGFRLRPGAGIVAAVEDL